MAKPGYLALAVWINTSALFMWLEHFSKEHYHDKIAVIADETEHMTSVPDAMYWCCIYLTGEWANVDFSFAGSRLSIFYVYFGISMFSIPTAIVVESVQASIEWVAQEETEVVALANSTDYVRKSQANANLSSFTMQAKP